MQSDEDSSCKGSDNIDWGGEDDLEVENSLLANCSNVLDQVQECSGSGEASTSTICANSKLFEHFVGMGFHDEMVAKVIEERGEENVDTILETLLTYSALQSSSPEQLKLSQHANSECSDSDYYKDLDDLSDIDTNSETEVTTNCREEKEKLSCLVGMGYRREEASAAIAKCGRESSIDQLIDAIFAAQMEKASNAHLGETLHEEELRPTHVQSTLTQYKKRKFHFFEMLNSKKKLTNDYDDVIRLPNPMIGFGVPNEPHRVVDRTLPKEATGPPFFYYENVACAPRGVWSTISQFLFDIEPEFVDSKYFCAAARKRGYVHNLPIKNRNPLLPLPPRTIHEAFPLTRKWWPSWDPRTNLNCLQTAIASAKLTERLRKALEACDGNPPLRVQKEVLEQCRKWNLVWVGKNKLAPLEPDEFEVLLGFPANHTRGGGISRTDRYKSLGNSFQVNTVAYHFSVLKDIFPDGMNLLSLFSGIGGAEVALHRLDIRLKNVVSVEKSKVNRDILRSWWEQSNQSGTLIDIEDVQELDVDQLKRIMQKIGGFDLVVGGSPCNNLAGSNRVSRDGLEGAESILFYDFFRILGSVKDIMCAN